MTLNLEFDLDRFEMNRQAKRNIQVKGHLAHKSLSEHTDTHRPGCSTWATKMVGNKQVMPNSLNNAKCDELLAFCNDCSGAIILPYFSAEYITLLTYSRRVWGMKERPGQQRVWTGGLCASDCNHQWPAFTSRRGAQRPPGTEAPCGWRISCAKHDVMVLLWTKRGEISYCK